MTSHEPFWADQSDLTSADERAIAEIAALLKASVEASFQSGATVRRDAHPKHHGCVKAWFTVAADLPGTLRHGVFATPARYAAWIRFSNGAPKVQSDHRPDQRGLAIKLMGVAGPKLVDDARDTQDFVLSSAPRFFIRSIADYVAFTRRAARRPAIRVLGFFFGWNPWRWKRYEFGLLRASLIRATNLLTLRYYSQTPYQLGPNVVRYEVRPTSVDPGLPASRSPQFLRENLAAQLADGEASFDFFVQVQTNPATMPVGDSTISWPEDQAPLQRVATITIPSQEFLSDRRMALAEYIQMSAWHALPAHRPLGPVNAIRRVVYEVVARRRLELNGVHPWQPTSHDDLGEFPVKSDIVPDAPKRNLAQKILLGATVLFISALGWALWPVTKNLPVAPVDPAPAVVSQDLTPDERSQYYHLTEGGEMFPVSFLLALERKPAGSSDYRPFMENLDRYGLIPDAVSKYNPYGFPVGLTIGYSKISGMQMMGFNCTACHVGQITYQGRAIRIDGAGNMSFVNQFITDIIGELQATAADPVRLTRFAGRVRRVKLAPVPAFPVVKQLASLDDREEPPAGYDLDEGLDGGAAGLARLVQAIRQMTSTNRGLLLAKLATLKSANQFVSPAMLISTKDGFGRNDAFGVGRNELFGGFSTTGFAAGLNATPAVGPVSLPHTWGMEYTSWLQWSANTNSVIERNIGQALGVGATASGDGTSTVRVDHLATLERLTYKLTPPQWPEAVVGPVDRARAARGKQFFDRTCALCHESYTKTPEGLNEYQLFPLDVVGTDPNTATQFEQQVMTADGPQYFGPASFAIITKVKQKYYADNQIPKALQDQWENVAMRPIQTFRSALRQYQEFPDTRNHGVYRAKTLKGIWATGPFLHNGSVPTIWDLLRPAERRPRKFSLGTREYDTEKLGYVASTSERFVLADGLVPTTLDTSLPGNLNTGHEWWFYPAMTDQDRWDVIEFLKTFNGVSDGLNTFDAKGDYQFPKTTKLPDDVRAPWPLSQARGYEK